MNIHAVPQLTPAETALVDAFGERLSLLPGDGAVMVKRDDAIEQVKTGLPEYITIVTFKKISAGIFKHLWLYDHHAFQTGLYNFHPCITFLPFFS